MIEYSGKAGDAFLPAGTASHSTLFPACRIVRGAMRPALPFTFNFF